MDQAGFDAELGVYALFAALPRAEMVYFRLVVEAWEDYAVARTVDRFCEEDRTLSLAVVMAVPDFIEPCRRRLALLCEEVGGHRVAPTPALLEGLRRDLLGSGPLPSDEDS